LDPSLLIFLALVAALYASVGHGGASGYLAVMALAGMPPAVMKPTALVLNIAVSCIGAVLFFRAGHFAWRLFWPFAVVSVPFAYLGGACSLGAQAFRYLVAGALLFSSLRLLLPAPRKPAAGTPLLWVVVLAGAGIGFASGLIGVGGGIFLTPLLLFCGWSEPKTAAAVSAPFIFVNSAAGLLGNLGSLKQLPPMWPWLALVVVAGGLLGARWGSRLARPAQLRPVLALVLLVAAIKLALV
jgi:uncharacterized membrane protein YfcA